MVQAVNDSTVSRSEDVETAYKFALEFMELLETHGTNKRLKRMIEEKTLSFGPKRKGPNILINKYMKREESFFQKIYQQAIKINGIVREGLSDGSVKKHERRMKEDD